MRLPDLIFLSSRSLRNRLSRVVFTTLGVAVAIGAVLSLVSLGYGLQNLLLKQITTEDSLLTLDVISPDLEILPLTREVASSIASLPGVEEVVSLRTLEGSVQMGEVAASASLILTPASFFRLGGITSLHGELPEENTENGATVVVSRGLASAFGTEEEELVGKQISVSLYLQAAPNSPEITVLSSSHSFTITALISGREGVGEVFLTPESIPGLPFSAYQSLKVKAESNEAMKGVRESLIGSGFLVSALSDTIDQANTIFSIIQVVLGIFGTVALIVAAIGLINTMTITLLERTNEIGILRAIGATKNDIRLIFLGESTILGFLGGVTGIILGILFSEGVNGLFNLLAISLGAEPLRLFSYPVWFLFFILSISAFVGFLGGYWPARRASMMDPLEALRYK